jgi:hypothetical protein
MDAFLSLRVGSNPWLRLLPMLVFAAFLPAISVNAQSAATNASTNSSSTTMKTFVIIFRQGPRQLTDNEKQHRDEETKAWARQQNASGHKLDPHILAPEGERRGPENSAANPAGAWTVTALLFLEAHDLNEATQVAEAHPTLHYGANVEIRPWAPPVRSAAAKPAATP